MAVAAPAITAPSVSSGLSRNRDTHLRHWVIGLVDSFGFAVRAKVVVRANGTFVTSAEDGSYVASIADDAAVDWIGNGHDRLGIGGSGAEKRWDTHFHHWVISLVDGFGFALSAQVVIGANSTLVTSIGNRTYATSIAGDAAVDRAGIGGDRIGMGEDWHRLGRTRGMFLTLVFVVLVLLLILQPAKHASKQFSQVQNAAATTRHHGEESQ
jgi:hypothetical protein